MNMASYGSTAAERMNEYELRLNSCGKNERVWLSYGSTVAERINEYGGVTAQLGKKE